MAKCCDGHEVKLRKNMQNGKEDSYYCTDCGMFVTSCCLPGHRLSDGFCMICGQYSGGSFKD